jgi:cullin-4
MHSSVLLLPRFPVAASDVKKRVEALIEREYLCRDESSPGIYNYLA